ncbi:MAG TPA: sigma-70 family RNA polymerase sigma factor [Sphingomonas sp.]|nr:sigma-70 family RNA polymerase sigma factor [Sphingomonas sp.]
MSDPRPRVDRVLPPEASAQAEALNQRFRPALMSFFLRRIHNFAEAEDLTQDVIVRISERAATIDASRPDAYVFQIAANLLRDHWRRSKVRTSYEMEAVSVRGAWMDEIDPERALQSRQALSTVTGAIRAMPERTRTIFVLFRLEHMKQREIADLLGVSVRTVEQHVMRASLILRDSLKDENGSTE